MSGDSLLRSKVLFLALLLLLMSFTCFLLFPDNYFRLQVPPFASLFASSAAVLSIFFWCPLRIV
jgi:multisubunit Na+/H+ antiporter MnhG subunit